MDNGSLPINPIRGADNTIFTANDAGALEGLGLLAGLTKREHFAGLAMQGFAANVEQYSTKSAMAADAVDWADALLKELSK